MDPLSKGKCMSHGAYEHQGNSGVMCSLTCQVIHSCLVLWPAFIALLHVQKMVASEGALGSTGLVPFLLNMEKLKFSCSRSLLKIYKDRKQVSNCVVGDCTLM